MFQSLEHEASNMIEEEDNNIGIDSKVRSVQDVCDIILVIRRGYILISLVTLSLGPSLMCLLMCLIYTLHLVQCLL